LARLGAAEMFLNHRHQEQIKIKDRRGFVRMAVEHGVDIVPVRRPDTSLWLGVS
jgi:hypothetical protein